MPARVDFWIFSFWKAIKTNKLTTKLKENLAKFYSLYFWLFKIGSIAIGIKAIKTAATPMYGALQDDQNFRFGRNIVSNLIFYFRS